MGEQPGKLKLINLKLGETPEGVLGGQSALWLL